ncbi:hypothetical protein F511_28977 [Dorcoceras hygrometricum]|uniref:Uncharacterized protein n=1 Tax=Dorcoceras hygrometricum TaxID=472368 RepID=A0A2Z7DBH4_9LAMI|nr:hypothetical protein F511_28977 [Dorcoceras hygrometricum]
MSLNCLGRVDSGKDSGEDGLNKDVDDKKPGFGPRFLKVDRSWSGNLEQMRLKPNYQQMRSCSNLGPTSKPKTPSPPNCSLEPSPSTPRLDRSSGMRREWSFEDLRPMLRG